MRRRGFLSTLLLPFLPTPQLPWEDEEALVPCGVRIVIISEFKPIDMKGDYALFAQPGEFDDLADDPEWVEINTVAQIKTLEEFKATFGDFS